MRTPRASRLPYCELWLTLIEVIESASDVGSTEPCRVGAHQRRRTLARSTSGQGLDRSRCACTYRLYCLHDRNVPCGSTRVASVASSVQGWRSGVGNDRDVHEVGCCRTPAQPGGRAAHAPCADEDPGDGSLIRAALNDVARGNMASAREAGMSREGLYKALASRRSCVRALGHDRLIPTRRSVDACVSRRYGQHAMTRT